MISKQTPVAETIWDDLLKALRNQQCVLFLGPDLLPDTSLFSELWRYLGGDPRADPPLPPPEAAAAYPNDGLFLFAHPGERMSVSFRLDDFYRGLAPRLAPIYAQLAALPLPLVVSLLPDDGLHEAFDQAGTPHQFQAYNFRGHAAADIKPPKQQRLIFNLFGSVNVADSLLLDHDDLFGFFSQFMGARKLSDTHIAVQEMLGSGSTVFLFVGFQFDKWPMQLLLRALNPSKFKARQYAVAPGTAQETRVFFDKQFKMSFVDALAPADFLAELGRRWQAAQSVNEAGEGGVATQQQLRDWLRLAQTERVLTALEKIAQQKADPDLERQVALLWARHNKRELAQIKGTIAAADEQLEANRILDALLEIIANL